MKYIKGLLITLLCFVLPCNALSSSYLPTEIQCSAVMEKQEKVVNLLATTYHIKCDSPYGYRLYLASKFNGHPYRDLQIGDSKVDKSYVIYITQSEWDQYALGISIIRN